MTSSDAPSGHDADAAQLLALENLSDGSVRYVSAEDLKAWTILTVHSDDVADESETELLARTPDERLRELGEEHPDTRSARADLAEIGKLTGDSAPRRRLWRRG